MMFWDKYIVVKRNKIYGDYPSINGIWYTVELKRNILNFWYAWLADAVDYSPHRNKDEAIVECKLRNKGKWIYEKSKKVAYDEGVK